MPTGAFPALAPQGFNDEKMTGTGAPSQPSGPTPLGGQQLPTGLPSNTPGVSPTPSGSGTGTGIFGDLLKTFRSLPQQLANQLSNPTYGQYQSSYGQNLGPLTSLVNGIYGPQQLLLSDQLSRQQDLYKLMGLNVQYDQDALVRDTELQRKYLGLEGKGIDVEQGLVGGQLANLGRLRDILAQQQGLTKEQLDNQLKQLGIDEKKVRDLAAREIWDLRSQLTARGAFNTIANERGTGRVNRDLDYALGGINVQRTAADIGYRNAMLGLGEKEIGYDNQELSLNARLSQLGLDEQKLGISLEKLENQLADGLRQLGLDGIMSLNNILDSIGSTNQQQAALGTQILNQLLGLSGLPPDVINQLLGALGLNNQTYSPPPTSGSNPEPR